jgi:hypothetical protein
MPSRTLAAVAFGLLLSVSACTASAKTANTAPPGGAGAAPGGPDGFQGNLVTSGPYAATWTASPDAEPRVFNDANSVELASDRQTFGHVDVKPDGSVSFGSAATELSSNGAYRGSGAKVTLDKSAMFVCAFSVDTDLTGATDGTKLHIKGSMSVQWHPQGLGDLACP